MYVEGFDSCFQLAGGVNLPKILSCQGSDGNRRRQLVKVGGAEEGEGQRKRRGRGERGRVGIAGN